MPLNLPDNLHAYSIGYRLMASDLHTFRRSLYQACNFLTGEFSHTVACAPLVTTPNIQKLAPHTKVETIPELEVVMVQRICWTLRVKPDRVNDYRETHAAIPEYFLDALREAGWRNYSIYLMPDGLVIGYVESDNWDESRKKFFARADVFERYGAEIGDRMKDAFIWPPAGPPTDPLKIHPCEELVFRLD